MRILLAALASLTLATSAPAAFAQPSDYGQGYRDRQSTDRGDTQYRSDMRTRGDMRDNRDNRGMVRDYGSRRGHHYGWRNRQDRVCYWRHHQRICRWRHG